MAPFYDNPMIRQITSAQHPLVKHLVRLRQNRDHREEHQHLVLIGTQLIREVCPQHKAKRIILSDEGEILAAESLANEVVIASSAIISKITGMTHSEGWVAEMAMPSPSSLQGLHWIVAFDKIRDPGNMGTLLRSGLALGWEGFFILNNSCDPYNDKALRAAKGATFRLPIAQGSWEDLKQVIQNNGLYPIVADLQGRALNQIHLSPPILLVLSNEAQGVSFEAETFCHKVTIPMPGKAESLNVSAAGAILMYALKEHKGKL